MITDTSEELIREFLKEKASRYGRDWYTIPGAQEFLNATNQGQTAFTWEARYKDGTIHYQYDEITFFRALKDEAFVPSADLIISTDKLDKKQTVHYELYPIAYTQLKLPWFQRSYRVSIRPEKGERLLAYWCVDFNPTTQTEIRRNVIGIKVVDEDEKELSRSVFIISSTGAMVFASSDNLSIEGE